MLFENNLTNCSNYFNITQSEREPSTALQNLSIESIPDNGENNDSNLPVKTHAAANNVPATESILDNGERTIPFPVPTQENTKEDCPKIYAYSNNMITTSIHFTKSIGTIDCTSRELYNKELLDASVFLDWNNASSVG